MKVESACSLLKYHGCTIREAAESVGIDDLNYFSRLIRSHTGYSPGRLPAYVNLMFFIIPAVKRRNIR